MLTYFYVVDYYYYANRSKAPKIAGNLKFFLIRRNNIRNDVFLDCKRAASFLRDVQFLLLHPVKKVISFLVLWFFFTGIEVNYFTIRKKEYQLICIKKNIKCAFD